MKLLRTLGVLALCCSAAAAQQREQVSVAVFGLFHPKQLTVEAVSEPLVLTDGKQEFIVAPGPSHRVTITRIEHGIRVQSSGNTFQTAQLAIRSKARDEARFRLSVPGKLRREYLGTLTIQTNGKELVSVVSMPLETAVASIVAAELPANTPLEALKAQAVVTRSYFLARPHRHAFSDFCDTTHCQFLKSPPPPSSPAVVAANATNGMVLAWNSKPFAAMFSASCGGRTHSLAEVGYTVRDYPYFPVECRYCRNSPDQWSRTMPHGATPTHPGSEPARVLAGRELGWSAVPSTTFEIKRNADGVMELTGTGHGHGIGLCQRGAAAMAREGKDFKAILAHYFPNTTLQ